MEDSLIIEYYWQRDHRAVAETAEKYGHYCYTIAINVLKRHEDAEECENDTYMKVWNSIPPNRPVSLRAFLGRLTRNTALNMLRTKRAVNRGGCSCDAAFEEISEVVSGEDITLGEVEKRELVKAIDEFLSELPREKRRIFMMRYWYFESVSEIAARFGKRENTISVMLGRIRNKLRIYLQERGFEL